jgi:phosphohistidine phosphatase
MILTIWRHGETEAGRIDSLRELTGSGLDDVGFGAHRFHAACDACNIPHPHKILHSPLVRTAQTAEIIAAAFTHASVTAVRALQPDSDIAAVDAAVSEYVDSDYSIECKQHTLLVSHQPLVSQLVDHYLGSSVHVPFLCPGGLVTLSLELPASACGSLLFWALPPNFEMSV